MKTFKSLGLVALSVLTASTAFMSCTDLEPEVFGAVVDETPVSCELPLLSDPQASLISVYNGLNDFTDQGQMFSLMEHTSDELIGPTRGTDWSDLGVWRQLHAHTWNANHAQIRNAYNNLANRYFGATRVIASTQDPQLLAEAKFLRAFFMGHMVDFFGQVPFREAQEGICFIPRTLTRTEAFALVEKDLKEAIQVLPEYTNASTGTRTGSGAMSKQAAQAYLMRMLLNKAVYTSENPAGPYNFDQAVMQEIIALGDAIIATPGLTLQAPGTYFRMFSPDNTTASTENIFALQFEGGDGIGASSANRYRMTLHYNTEIDGWNGFTTIADFYNKWNQNDERFGAPPLADDTGIRAGFLVGQQFKITNGVTEKVKNRAGNDLIFTPEVDLFYASEAAGVRVIKYYPDVADPGDPSNDFVFLRLGDVYLMKAEAQLRNGNPAVALATVNLLRASRQGAPALTSLDELALLDERGFELYWEGIRRTDQIRFGQYTRPYSEKEYESDPRVFLFPIPQDQLVANPNISQNPGY